MHSLLVSHNDHKNMSATMYFKAVHLTTTWRPGLTEAFHKKFLQSAPGKLYYYLGHCRRIGAKLGYSILKTHPGTTGPQDLAQTMEFLVLKNYRC